MLLDECGEHVPLTTVARHRLQQISHGPVVDITVGGVDDRLEKVVGTLELVPEHHVILGKLE